MRDDNRISTELSTLGRLTPPEWDAIGARQSESMRQYVARLAACPRCSAVRASPCSTQTGRNHTERIHAAMRRELELWDQLWTSFR